MSDNFDYMTEHRIDGISKIYVDYNGNICFEWEEYGCMGGVYNEEREFTIEEIEQILELAKQQREKYNKHMAEI